MLERQYEIFAMPDKIAVKLSPPAQQIGAIHLPDTVKGDNHVGTIVSVGWCQNSMINLRVGDTVVVPRYAGSPVIVDGEELLFMKASDVLATLLPIPRGVEAAHAGLD